jgi:2-methylisocitrate lyase-like PEP mutase family enzyme
MDQAAALRRLLDGPGMLVAPGAYDALGAMLVEQAGFAACYMTGAGTSVSRGYPDFGLLTMSEMVDNAARMAASIGIPLIADADTGYGNAVNLVRTVREYERIGVAAIHIEDQITPKRCGHLDGKEVIPLAEMEMKLDAALKTRSDGDFCIIARTDARGVHGFDDAIQRAKAFAKLGVDAIFVEAPQSEEELAEIPRRLPDIPLLVNVFKGGKTPMLPMERLEKMGYRIAIYPSETQRAAIHAMRNALATLKREGTTESIDATLTTFKERDRVVGLDDWQKIERQFMAVNVEKA